MPCGNKRNQKKKLSNDKCDISENLLENSEYIRKLELQLKVLNKILDTKDGLEEIIKTGKQVNKNYLDQDNPDSNI